jgi:two-component system sensor histidine kinase YesM
VKPDGNDAVICVCDNGIGMDPAQLSALLDAIEGRAKQPGAGETRSVGLSNIAHRLNLKYGERYGIHIESACDVGTSVTIRIPQEH